MNQMIILFSEAAKRLFFHLSCSSNHPGAISVVPQTAATTFAFSSVYFFFNDLRSEHRDLGKWYHIYNELFG